MPLTPVPAVTYPDVTGDFVLERLDGAWRITHHNIEDSTPSVFEFDSIPSAMGFLDACGVSRTIGG